MYQHLFLRLLFSLLLTTLALTGCTPDGLENTASSSQPPFNIVFILVDDLGWADLPGYGNAFHETPHIDRLIAQGVRFTEAYAAAPVCSPTRASIQSGQYPARLGLTDFITGHWRPYEAVTVPINRTQYLPLEVVTISEQLKEAGYATGYFGKWHLDDYAQGDKRPAHQGYDEAIEHRGWGHFGLNKKLLPPQTIDSTVYLSDALTDMGIEFIQSHQDTSFFLTISHFGVHIPLEADSAKITKYDAKPAPSNGVNNPTYAAMIEHIDDGVGRILETLETLELTEKTMIVFLSDNGGLYERFDKADGVIVTSNAPLRDEKGSLYEGGIRVPLIVSLPGTVEQRTDSHTVVSSVDLYPTFLDAAALETPPIDAVLDGESFWGALQTASPLPNKRPVFFHYPHYHHSEPAGAIREGDYKLIEFYADDRLELYNLRNDIGEANNLATSDPDRAAQLQEQLADWRLKVEAAMPVPNPEFDPTRRSEWGQHPSRSR